MRPAPEIDACRTSHQRLLAALATLTDGDFRSPRLLPRWSRGHVVTHLANKTTTLVWLFRGPAEGEIGYRVSDWPRVFVDGELTKRLRALPDRADHADLLAWLLGRAPVPDLKPW